ncbi:DUF3797 domain-containing protein [Oceanobacillus kimchii]|uniref:DUF3797 domain-containing protein n=1 Tax=Oceanobacillus kimchii TaxID=746691 RepID=A0ABQ5TJR2_9BACI|nr:DUF3797 domain-containing protein [Oceanobacillus kimchii]GLO66240.1 hypothetical protein MACH08_20240 [Oceanobacillus kimchii]
MNALDYLAIAPHLHNCANCGSETIGNGKGSVSIEETSVVRGCDCGFVFHFDTTNGTADSIVKQSINTQLDKFKEDSIGI